MSELSSIESKTKKQTTLVLNDSLEKVTAISNDDSFGHAGEFSNEDLEIISEHLDDRNLEENLKILNDALVEHNRDSSLDSGYYEALTDLAVGPSSGESQYNWEQRVKFEAFLIYDWSIYRQVRAVTRPIDEEDNGNEYETLRCYINGIAWSCSGSVLATFFNIRFPGIVLPSVALQILIAYTGRLFEYIPGFSFPIWRGKRIHFGNGKWGFKEQMLATCGMGVGNTAPYSQNVAIVMSNNQFYNSPSAQGNFGFIIMLTLSTNLMGFGLAGLFRVFLVYPVQLIWYLTLPSIRLCRVLVEPEPRENINGWTLSGYWVFWIATISNFCWYWITNYVFTFFSYLDWMAWINPNDNNLLIICGVATPYTMGYNPFPTLDPNVAGVASMMQPFFATSNQIIGMILAGLVVIGMYYQNTSWTGYFHINSNSLYNRFGGRYQVSKVLDKNYMLDKEKFLEYGLPFWSAGNLVAYGSFFAFYPAVIVHSILEYYKTLMYSGVVFAKVLRNPRSALASFDDRFSRAQRKYKEVPEWWYMLFLAICLGFGIATVKHYDFSNTPVWTIFFAVGLSAVFMIPCGILYAKTNSQIIINVLYELVIGLAIPGNGYALMVSKAYATNFMVETDNFIGNLKIGHYVGIKPRAMFRIQILSAIVNSFVQAGLITWQTQPGAIPNMCSPENIRTNKFICQAQRTYFNAAVQWGTIGPKRILRDLYPGMRYSFLFGACFPLPFYFLRHFILAYARRHELSKVKEGGSRFRNCGLVRWFIGCEWSTYINELVILNGCLSWGSANLLYYWPLVPIGYLFSSYLPKYYPRWWAKYNYLIYSGTNIGIAYSALIVFFALQYKNIPDWSWWGNNDGVGLADVPRLNATALAPDGFGPTSWRY